LVQAFTPPPMSTQFFDEPVQSAGLSHVVVLGHVVVQDAPLPPTPMMQHTSPVAQFVVDVHA
jgi:hypothetical protein